jgi:hypothetical protein
MSIPFCDGFSGHALDAATSQGAWLTVILPPTEQGHK